MSSNWLTNFDLFLRTKGSDDVQLWRLKKTRSLSSSSASSPIMRLTPDDFEYVSEVKDHQKLIENMFQWNITDYNNLINYISTRRLLVNGEGMVIAELLQYDEDENELPVYFRSSDVLSLKTYIPSVQNRKKGKDVIVPPLVVDSNSTLQEKLDKERSDKQILAKRVADLDAENKTLEINMTKLKADLGTKTNEIVALEVENKTLETDVTKLKADIATRTKENADLQTENKTCDVTKLEAELATKTKEIADLEAENKTLETNVTKLKADLATRTKEIADLQAENKTCDVTKLEADLATKTKELADLEVENKTLKTDVTKLKANLATKTNETAELEAENKTLETDVSMLKADLAAKTNEIADLESVNKTLETDVIKLKAYLTAKTNENADFESKYKILAARTNEVWMKDLTPGGPNWVGIERIAPATLELSISVTQNKGYLTKEDTNEIPGATTNVSTRYWFQASIKAKNYTANTYKVIEIDDLLPNKEKARFLLGHWNSYRSKGKTYAFSS